jgi:hypothetical protein
MIHGAASFWRPPAASITTTWETLSAASIATSTTEAPGSTRHRPVASAAGRKESAVEALAPTGHE